MLFIACMALWGLCNAQKGYHITGNLGQLQQDTFYLVVPNLNGTVNVLGVSILKEGNRLVRSLLKWKEERNKLFLINSMRCKERPKSNSKSCNLT